MANFLKNVIKGAGKVISKVATPLATVVGTGLGSLVGLPSLGAVAGKFVASLGKDKVDSIKNAAATQGVTKPAEIAKTIEKVTGEKAPSAVVAEITNAVAEHTDTAIEATAQIKVDATTGKAVAKFNLMDFVKKYWYFVVAVVVGAYFVFKPSKKSYKKRY